MIKLGTVSAMTRGGAIGRTKDSSGVAVGFCKISGVCKDVFDHASSNFVSSYTTTCDALTPTCAAP